MTESVPMDSTTNGRFLNKGEEILIKALKETKRREVDVEGVIREFIEIANVNEYEKGRICRW